ncbi:MAG: FmdB family zinc ribbon protein [Gemmatimonadota bacterium]
MPTYEYRCAECGHEFERFQKMNDTPVVECPDCMGEVQRLISSGGGLLFKGTGFYATDYRSGSPQSVDSGADSGGAGGETDGKSSDATSGKPDVKTGEGSKDE